MRITAIEPQQKNPQRVNIYLDGEFAFGLAKIVAAALPDVRVMPTATERDPSAWR